jgi:hypothetical protein
VRCAWGRGAGGGGGRGPDCGRVSEIRTPCIAGQERCPRQVGWHAISMPIRQLLLHLSIHSDRTDECQTLW